MGFNEFPSAAVTSPSSATRCRSSLHKPLPLGEAGRRPGEGAFRCGTFDESTLTPALSQRERENEKRQLRRPIRAAELELNIVN